MSQAETMYDAKIIEMGTIAEEELKKDPSLCNCTQESPLSGRYGNRCKHHQMIDWKMVIQHRQNESRILGKSTEA